MKQTYFVLSCPTFEKETREKALFASSSMLREAGRTPSGLAPFWDGFRLAWLMPFGMLKINIANMTLFKLYLDLKIQMAFRN